LPKAAGRRQNRAVPFLSFFMPATASIAKVTQYLKRNRAARAVLLYAAMAVIVATGMLVPRPKDALLTALENKAFDHQMQLLRRYFPQPLQKDVVLIGIDPASDERFKEPPVFWHRHYARVLLGLAAAEPAAVGVDIVLPDRSYNDILPGSDNALVSAIFALRQRTLLVYVQGVHDSGPDRGQTIKTLPIYLVALGSAKNSGVDQQLKDPDNIARRFSERELGEGGAVATFTGQILRGLNIPVQEGMIDFSVGGDLNYIPMQDVIDWHANGDLAKLKATFGGRIVLFGTLSTEKDRWVLPVNVATWEKLGKEYEHGQPGVVLHLQTLRSHLANGLIQPVNSNFALLLCLIAAGAVLLPYRTSLLVAGAILLPLALAAFNMLSIRTLQITWPVASINMVLWLALLVRGVIDAVKSVIERTRLKRNFSGSVSPAVMDEIMTGGLEPGNDAQTADVCVIFTDIRDFTTLTEEMSPDVVMSVLQRYFDRMVKSVHRFDGTIDKFIGDGMMILFGAPKATPDPCTDAVRCALDMLGELDQLNTEFERDGLPKLQIGIGVNYGKVVVGNIGSTERHNYSAIGDAVNVAARVEGQTKELGRRILITESVVSRIGDRFNFEPLGERLIKGHSPVKVWGIRATRNTRAAESDRENGEQEADALKSAPVIGGHS
jgi:adenylate cyclase